MDWRNDPLWRQLCTMRIEPEGATIGFSERLAQENRWSRVHALNVTHEYRRFLYLAATEGAGVTPSDDVDQAWHLHLAYSRHYWDVLCGRILKRPLHHSPTLGGAQSDHFRRQYDLTLQAYRATFGRDPPAGIWPAPAVRFAVRPVRIDASIYWMIPKTPVLRLTKAVSAAVAFCGSSAAAAALGAGEGEGGFLVPVLIGLLAVVLVSLIVIAVRKAGRSDRGDQGGCSSSGGSSDSSGGDSGCGGGCGGD